MNVRRTLSKSDFKLATDCRTKLYYKKLGYTNTQADNGYLMFLAEGGYLIGAISKICYPGGIDIDAQVRKPGATFHDITQDALTLTQKLMRREDVILYEPAFQVGRRLIRVDVLVKSGNQIDLIEVKSKSQNSLNTVWGPEWNPYLDDLAFQLVVVRKAYPSYQATPWLLSPDKSHVATIDNLTSYFRLHDQGYTGHFRNVEIEFVGDDALAAEIRKSDLLHRWDVRELIESRISAVESESAYLENWLEKESLPHPRTQISKKCFNCEYNSFAEVGVTNGFHECWGELAMPERHIRHLYRVGSLGGSLSPRANQWIQDGRVGHDDIETADLCNAGGQLGTYGTRMAIQIEHTREGTEWLDSQRLRESINSWDYPLHFIDFEATNSPVPYHSGMRPYQTVVFQWSCHTIESPESEPVHHEYLNTTSRYPAIEFLQSLREAIGDKGTAITWSPYENTQLTNLQAWIQANPESVPAGLTDWLESLLASWNTNYATNSPRLVDQHALVGPCWFHPLMKGQTSLKVALPSALAVAVPGRIDRWLAEVDLLDPQSGKRPDDPYAMLPSLGIEGLKSSELEDDAFGGVTDGVEAMRAYQDMIYGKHMSDPGRHQQISDALLRYCRLDTLAQLIIWEHWCNRLG
ncbi:MAG: DUF2779 domain-containing protein [Pirellulaceae bacterium]|nr:DUF2779 domain-containing protein [Pirellulaceae bacterium]